MGSLDGDDDVDGLAAGVADALGVALPLAPGDPDGDALPDGATDPDGDGPGTTAGSRSIG